MTISILNFCAKNVFLNKFLGTNEFFHDCSIVDPIADPNRISESLTTLMKDFEDYIKTFHHNVEAHSIEEYTTQHIVNILDIFKSFFNTKLTFDDPNSIKWMMTIFKGTIYEEEPKIPLSLSSVQKAVTAIRKKIAENCQKLWDLNSIKLIQSPRLEMNDIVSPIRNFVETTNLRYLRLP